MEPITIKAKFRKMKKTAINQDFITGLGLTNPHVLFVKDESGIVRPFFIRGKEAKKFKNFMTEKVDEFIEKELEAEVLKLDCKYYVGDILQSGLFEEVYNRSNVPGTGSTTGHRY